MQDRVSVLTCLHTDPRLLRTTMLSHDDDRAVTCTISGLEGVAEPEQLRVLFDKLLCAMAVSVPGRAAKGPGYKPELAEVALLEALADHGVVESLVSDGESHWFVTLKGLRKISYESGVGPGRLTLQLRALPIADMSAWEQTCKLLDDGWVWRPLPSKVVDRLKLPWFNTESKEFGDGCQRNVFAVCIGDCPLIGLVVDFSSPAPTTRQIIYQMCGGGVGGRGEQHDLK